MSLPSRIVRMAAMTAVTVGLLLGLGACQFQTLQRYNPADGVNVDVGSVKVRNVSVLVTAAGQGVLSGTVTADNAERLTSVNGVALLPDGSPGSQLQSAMPEPVEIPAKTPVVLTDINPIRLTGSDLKAGQLARITFTFAGGGSTEVTVPVLDKNSPEYVDLKIGSSSTPA
ncbi:MAG: hypothetical protein L0G99_02840 [Propionibacteriales bacterium]|nr:hypothetical protein [Propionibacteriales bacterium]